MDTARHVIPRTRPRPAREFDPTMSAPSIRTEAPAIEPAERTGAAASAIATITLAAFLLQGANGLLQALLPLRMDGEGLSILAIGTVATAYGLGFATGCFLAPHLVRHVGHIRAYASLAALSAVVVLGFDAASGAPAWIGLRFLSGMALAGLFTVVDSWVSATGTKQNRGRVIALYLVATKIALVLSPLGIGLGDVAGSGLVMTVAGLVCLSLIPIAGTLTREPRAPTIVRVRILPLFKIAPSAVVGAFAVGLINGPVVAVAPVYGLFVGLDVQAAALLLLGLQAGSLLAQWPLGWLSDRVDRRRVIAALFAATALACGAILAASAMQSVPGLVLAFGLYGAIALCIYAVCVAHACDLVSAEEIVPTVSSLLVCWALGATLGPLPATALMQIAGPAALFYYVGAIALALALFVVVRMRVRSRHPAGVGFVNVLATSPVTAEITESERERAGDLRDEGGDDPATDVGARERGQGAGTG